MIPPAPSHPLAPPQAPHPAPPHIEPRASEFAELLSLALGGLGAPGAGLSRLLDRWEGA